MKKVVFTMDIYDEEGNQLTDTRQNSLTIQDDYSDEVIDKMATMMSRAIRVSAIIDLIGKERYEALVGKHFSQFNKPQGQAEQ